MTFSTEKKLTTLKYKDRTFSGVETINKRVQNRLMADIDKSLPNQKTTVTIPGEVEVEE